jgi:RNA polymerase sigma-70 factor, ECF subfamily
MLEATIADNAFRSHERFIWGLCYRMTGDAADADDLVQETFARVIENPPPRLENLRPWLVRVAVNLSRDQYRRRKRREYLGPWLPSPIDAELIASSEPSSTEGRYELLESVSFAFLRALEALKPNERAVLILRDVFDYSAKEAAGALGISEANVRTTHLRARRAMEKYDAAREPIASRSARAMEVLGAFLTCLATQDVKGAEALLSEAVQTHNDSAGVYKAARRVVYGPEKVARFYVALASKVPAGSETELRMLNGEPAIVIRIREPRPREAPIIVIRGDVDPTGRLAQLDVILAPRKLKALAS